MVMALRRKEKCFDVIVHLFGKLIEIHCVGTIFQFRLVNKNLMRDVAVMFFGDAAQDEIEAMDGSSAHREVLANRLKAFAGVI